MSEKHYPIQERRTTLTPTQHGYSVGQDLSVVILKTGLAISSSIGYVFVAPEEAQALILAVADVASQVAVNRARDCAPN